MSWWQWALLIAWLLPLYLVICALLVWATTPRRKRTVELTGRGIFAMALGAVLWPLYFLRWCWWRWSIRKLSRLQRFEQGQGI